MLSSYTNISTSTALFTSDELSGFRVVGLGGVTTAAERRVAGLGDTATERGGESFAIGSLGSLTIFRLALHSNFRRMSQTAKLPLSCTAVGSSRGHGFFLSICSTFLARSFVDLRALPAVLAETMGASISSASHRSVASLKCVEREGMSERKDGSQVTVRTYQLIFTPLPCTIPW